MGSSPTPSAGDYMDEQQLREYLKNHLEIKISKDIKVWGGGCVEETVVVSLLLGDEVISESKVNVE